MAEDNKLQLQLELESLIVHGETPVGWDENSLFNETVDQAGNLSSANRGGVMVEPQLASRRVYSDPNVEALRAHLRQHNGIRGLEICEPAEIKKAARIFHRDGFVVVRDLLNSEQLSCFREGCVRVLRKILEIPGPGARKYMAETGRLPHRYSYGTSSASRHMLHDIVWASMIDLPTTTPILTEIFGSSDYWVWGSGGDLCLPGAIEYQHLHADIKDSQQLLEARIQQAEALDVQLSRNSIGELNVPTQKLVMEMTAPMVTINFLMSNLSWENGPIRQIPGTHTLEQSPPPLVDEPEWMRLSTLVGAPAGAGVFRDNRAWHGATPNLSKEVRALPNVEYAAPWRPPQDFEKTMPHSIWETLTPHAQRLCKFVKSERGVWPAGAGIMHPLASKQREALKVDGIDLVRSIGK